jgi:hypothetical protein
MEKTVPKFDFGRFTNEKAGVETSGHNTRLPGQQFAEPRLVPPSPLSVCLTARSFPSARKLASRDHIAPVSARPLRYAES